MGGRAGGTSTPHLDIKETWLRLDDHHKALKILAAADRVHPAATADEAPAHPAPLRRGRIAGGRFLEIPADATEGFDHALTEAFADPAVSLVHVRAVKYGCFFFKVRRPV
ncbi:DUF1203 domain-containing protein [Streptomyces gardneri]|uniref:DUF1203 domain-containing protein n=1 Tax=Streptomyces gardneri TaxID=66892 RepID=UPI0035E215DB